MTESKRPPSSAEAAAFENAMSRILGVSKDELKRREEDARKERERQRDERRETPPPAAE